MVIGNVDGSIQGWTTKDGWKSGVALKRPRAVTGLAYTADAKTLVESHAEGVELTDRKTGNYRGRVGPPAAGRAVVALAPHPRPDRVAVVGPDREVIVWDSTRNRPVRTYRGHTAGVSALAFSPDGTRLASAGGDLGVRVWDLGKEPGMRTVAEFPAPVGAFAAAADGSRFAVAPRFGASPAEHRIIVLDAAGKPVRVVPGAGDAALSRDGRRVAGGRPGGGVAVGDTTTAAEVWSRPEAGGARGGGRAGGGGVGPREGARDEDGGRVPGPGRSLRRSRRGISV
ncbi:hypothetical protein J0H58_36200, partial [bacterium]|nr:hypothetical protein [bacterium]